MPWRLPEDYDSNKDPFGYQNLSTIKLPWTYTFENWVKEITRVDDKIQLCGKMTSGIKENG